MAISNNYYKFKNNFRDILTNLGVGEKEIDNLLIDLDSTIYDIDNTISATEESCDSLKESLYNVESDVIKNNKNSQILSLNIANSFISTLSFKHFNEDIDDVVDKYIKFLKTKSGNNESLAFNDENGHEDEIVNLFNDFLWVIEKYIHNVINSYDMFQFIDNEDYSSSHISNSYDYHKRIFRQGISSTNYKKIIKELLSLKPLEKIIDTMALGYNLSNKDENDSHSINDYSLDFDSQEDVDNFLFNIISDIDNDIIVQKLFHIIIEYIYCCERLINITSMDSNIFNEVTRKFLTSSTSFRHLIVSIMEMLFDEYNGLSSITSFGIANHEVSISNILLNFKEGKNYKPSVSEVLLNKEHDNPCSYIYFFIKIYDIDESYDASSHKNHYDDLLLRHSSSNDVNKMINTIKLNRNVIINDVNYENDVILPESFMFYLYKTVYSYISNKNKEGVESGYEFKDSRLITDNTVSSLLFKRTSNGDLYALTSYVSPYPKIKKYFKLLY